MKKYSICYILNLLMLVGCSTNRAQPAQIVNVTQPSWMSQQTTSTAPLVPIVNTKNNKPVTTDTDNEADSTTVSKLTTDEPAIIKTVPSSPVKSKNVVANKQVASQVITKKPLVLSQAAVATNISSSWIMPVQGEIIQKFSPETKGIDIAAKEGQPIVAIADGKIVYSGNGLKGYGNLIIVKHNNTYLSAYAHNKVNLFKEGSAVKKGQKIAEDGSTDSKEPMLHLEIRQNGKPIDPLTLIIK